MPSLKSYNSTTGRWEYVNADNKPYLSFKRRSRYLYDVSFISEPVDNGLDTFLTALCSSYVKDGKLYRNLDWRYDHTATFHVQLPDMEGLSFINGLTDDSLDDTLISQLPYHMVDGVNENGIMVSTHVLYNDWNFEGTGSIPLTKLPYLALKNVKSMATIETDLADILDNIVLPSSMQTSEYLIQVLVTDGTTSYILTPDTENNGIYVAVDISSNPKLTNFKWVSDETVVRTDLQTRPTGVERWNMMPCSLEDLRFTKAYESPIWLSEFIGEDGTTKDSTDAELTEIYNASHAEYLVRTRDGTLWQTMHSAVYSSNGLEHLWIQENWEKDYIASSQKTANSYLPITLSSSWTEVTEGQLYSQVVTLTDYTVTDKTKVDLVSDATVIFQLEEDGVDQIYIQNDNGILTAYAVGSAPSSSITVYAMVMEVE